MDVFWTKVKLYFFRLRHFAFGRMGFVGKLFSLLLCLSIVGGIGFGTYWYVLRDEDSKGNDIFVPVSKDADTEILTEHLSGMPTVGGERNVGSYTFLIVGTDEAGTNADLIIVAKYDVRSHKVTLVSFPKNTIVNAPWDIKRLGNAYAYYTDGMLATQDYIRSLIGFTTDFTIQINMAAFVELVNTLDGIDYNVPIKMDYEDTYQNLSIHLSEGLQHLTGEQVLQLVRFNQYGDSGYSREQTQSEVLKILVEEALSVRNWTKIKDYVGLLNYVQTNLNAGNILYFAGEALLNGIQFQTVSVEGTEAGVWSRTALGKLPYVFLDQEKMVTLSNTYLNPFFEEVTADMTDYLSLNQFGMLESTTGTILDKGCNDVYEDWLSQDRPDEPFVEPATLGPATPTIRNSTEEETKPEGETEPTSPEDEINRRTR